MTYHNGVIVYAQGEIESHGDVFVLWKGHRKHCGVFRKKLLEAVSKIMLTVKQAVFDREREDKYVETRSVERLA